MPATRTGPSSSVAERIPAPQAPAAPLPPPASTASTGKASAPAPAGAAPSPSAPPPQSAAGTLAANPPAAQPPQTAASPATAPAVHGPSVPLASSPAAPAPATLDARAAHAPAARLLQNDAALARWVADHSQEVAAARFELGSARASERDTHLLPNPVVDFSVANFALGETNPPHLGLDRTLIYGVGLSETFELGKRGPRMQAAALRTRGAQSQLTTTLADRIADARLALAQLVYARARASELQSSLDQARAAVLVAQGRLQYQALSGVDYDRLLIDLSRMEIETARAQSEADAAATTCSAALRAPCDLAATSVAVLGPAAPVPPSFDPAALKRRPDVRGLRFESMAARKDAQLAAARALPDLTFRLGYVRDLFTISGDQAHTLGLSLSAPLPVFDHGQYAQEQALARADQYAQLAASTVTRARGDVAALFTRKHAVEDALQKLEQDALPRAESVLKSQERGLHEGQLDITDLLLARREAIALRLQLIELQFELFTIRNDIRHMLGLDPALAPR